MIVWATFFFLFQDIPRDPSVFFVVGCNDSQWPDAVR